MLLALDTATAATVVGVQTAAGGVVERRDDPPAGERPHHADRLLALATEALSDAGTTLAAVERVAVGVGPGGFTGLRIGVATARALAQGLGVPLVGVSSLHALALGASTDGPVLAVLDARRGEAFVAVGRGGDLVVAPRVVLPAELPDLARAWAGDGLVAVGDGALRFGDELERVGATVPAPGSAAHRIGAVALCELAAGAPDLGRDAVVPDYLRVPDAEITRRARTP